MKTAIEVLQKVTCKYVSPKDIEKAAEKFLRENPRAPQIDFWSFKQGAKWMQEKLSK